MVAATRSILLPALFGGATAWGASVIARSNKHADDLHSKSLRISVGMTAGLIAAVPLTELVVTPAAQRLPHHGVRVAFTAAMLVGGFVAGSMTPIRHSD